MEFPKGIVTIPIHGNIHLVLSWRQLVELERVRFVYQKTGTLAIHIDGNGRSSETGYSYGGRFFVIDVHGAVIVHVPRVERITLPGKIAPFEAALVNGHDASGAAMQGNSKVAQKVDPLEVGQRTVLIFQCDDVLPARNVRQRDGSDRFVHPPSVRIRRDSSVVQLNPYVAWTLDCQLDIGDVDVAHESKLELESSSRSSLVKGDGPRLPKLGAFDKKP